MKNLLCAVALLFSSVAPVAKAMGKYEPDTCKVQIFEITSSSSAQINEEDPDEPDFEPYDADSYNAPGEGEEEIALLNFDLPQGCVADLAQLELFRLNGAAALYPGVWDASTSWNSMSGNGGVIPPQYALYPSFTTDPFSSAFLSADVTDDVAAWLANPADNQGWAFISLMNDMTPNSWGFVTSMNDKPAEHPKLVVVAANCP